MKGKRILLAEDNPYSRETIRFILKNAGYDIIAVQDGGEALNTIDTVDNADEFFHLLITDIQMPGVSGIELIDRLLERKIHLPILVITAFGDKEMLIQLMRKGCDNFIEKPFEPDDLLKQVEVVLARNEELLAQRKEQLAQIEEEKVRLGREIETYRSNYMNLRKQFESAVNAYENIINIDVSEIKTPIAYHFKPFSRLGGDIFDVRNTPDGVQILVADVAGHDIGASFHAILLKAFFDENSKMGKRGSDFFHILNNQLIENAKVERMVTAVFLDINLKTMMVEAVCAGHPPFIRIDTGLTLFPPSADEGNTVLGIYNDLEYHSIRFPIQSGERFILYTDGITDAFHELEDGKVKKLTLAGLMRCINLYRQRDLKDLVDCTWNDVQAFCSYNPPDDMLLLGVSIP